MTTIVFYSSFAARGDDVQEAYENMLLDNALDECDVHPDDCEFFEADPIQIETVTSYKLTRI